ncbi:hypothetical protein SKAU_G00025420 [Synaphobranchus kaupii]|uniref:Uncharacterized protein n=1 Tax=Synaphobranchus kaupii TaxID=118154 RepID=A0A9Q1JF45_SYNKA|nr:hypothetical protein SKAU_G00025420 [Synaphobranchus kaupii]
MPAQFRSTTFLCPSRFYTALLSLSQSGALHLQAGCMYRFVAFETQHSVGICLLQKSALDAEELILNRPAGQRNELCTERDIRYWDSGSRSTSHTRATESWRAAGVGHIRTPAPPYPREGSGSDQREGTVKGRSCPELIHATVSSRWGNLFG